MNFGLFDRKTLFVWITRWRLPLDCELSNSHNLQLIQIPWEYFQMAANNWMSLGTFETLYPVLGKVSKMDTPFNISSPKIMITTSLGELHEILIH